MRTNITFKSMLLATVFSTIVDAIVFALTQNGIMAVTLIPFLVLFFSFMICVKGFRKIVKVVATIVAIIALALCIYNGKIKNEELSKDIDDSVAQVIEDEKEDKKDDTDDETEEKNNEDGTTTCSCGCPYCCGGSLANVDAAINENAGTVSSKKSTGSGKSNTTPTASEKMVATYQGEKSTGSSNKDKELPSIGKNIVGDDKKNITPEEGGKMTEELEKQKNEGKKVEENPSGVITTSDENTTNKKPQGGNQNKDLDAEHAVGDVSTTPEPTPQPSYKGPSEMTDEEQNNKKPEDKETEEKESENQKPEESKKPEEKEPEEKIIPVSIRALSETAVAGDTIQFEVGGTVKEVSGFNGISVANIKNGMLSISTQSGVSQKITITVVGKDGSKASASVDVKSIEDTIKEKDNSKEVEDKKEPSNTEQEQAKPQYTPVSIRVDSKEAYVGDSVQFFITGDVESVSGSGKTVNDIKGGVLQVEAKQQGTITITVKGKDGSTASESVTVKAIPGTDKQEAKPSTETPKTEEAPKQEETKKETTPVSISVVGGKSTFVSGETIQFKVGGDVASIEGTDGLSTSNKNGILTVQTNPGEATVIEIVVNGVDGSTATAVVTVNAI